MKNAEIVQRFALIPGDGPKAEGSKRYRYRPGETGVLQAVLKAIRRAPNGRS
ncbi:MAG: hypothetical protein JWO70_447 [Betaproteobacteria bacterium]|nr:hypothetical protein [Betaproteobacteria bacterium]